MRLSTLAALMILTTIMLSACSQQNMATVIDNSGQFYGRDAYPRYSSNNPAPMNPSTAYKYPSGDQYALDAEVASVTSQDLPPPAMNVASSPFSSPTPAPAIKTSAPSRMIETASNNHWEWPAQGKVTTKYGDQGNGIASEGIVIAANEGAPIRAAGEGQVAYVGNDLSDFGNIVILRHADGVLTSYANAREILVVNGDHVRQGDLLGYVGKTGNAQAPQLHFSMRVSDASVDPLYYLPQTVASR